ncbi:MAG: ACT domain-containing protein [Nitrososphaeria archaeon]
MTNISHSITGSVKEIVNNNIFIQSSIREGYANYSAIARKIKPLVDKKVGFDVSYQSIVTSLKRLKPATPNSRKDVLMVLADSDVSVKTGVAKITVEKTRAMMIKFTEFVRKYVQFIIHVSLATSAITIILEEGCSEEAYNFLGRGASLEFRKGLAAIIVSSTPDITDVPGCAISLYEKLFMVGINIEDTSSSYTDTIILVKTEDVGRAFVVLNDLINEARREVRMVFHQT